MSRIHIYLVMLAALAAVSCSPIARMFDTRVHEMFRCSQPGNRCCDPDSSVKVKHCHKGLGCNITTGKCETCGAAGQPCCDGHFTGFSLLGYSGFLLDPDERIESCNPGTSCDAHLAPGGESWTGTRTCQGCG